NPLDWITLVSHTVSGSAGIFLNSVFIYLLLFRSDKHLKSYAILLLNACITDNLASFCVLYTISRQIPVTKTSGVGIYLGPCSHIAVCVLCYLPTLHYVVALSSSYFIHDGYEERKKELIATVIAVTRPDLM
ncbi:hypothetical protein PENTCL1PPCAC_609, partial [Pristionchus entomophagus]